MNIIEIEVSKEWNPGSITVTVIYGDGFKQIGTAKQFLVKDHKVFRQNGMTIEEYQAVKALAFVNGEWKSWRSEARKEAYRLNAEALRSATTVIRD